LFVDEALRHAIAREATSQSAAEIAKLEAALEEKVRPLEEAKLQAPSAAWLGCKRAMKWIGSFLLRVLTLLPEIALRIADMYFKGGRYRKVITQRQLDQAGRAWSRSGREANREPEERTRGEIDAEIAQLHDQFDADKQAIEARYDHEQLFRQIEKDSIPPRKSDIDVNDLQILWRPAE